MREPHKPNEMVVIKPTSSGALPAQELSSFHAQPPNNRSDIREARPLERLFLSILFLSTRKGGVRQERTVFTTHLFTTTSVPR